METVDAYRWRKQVVWGLMMIAVGAIVLLDRLYYIDAGQYWHYYLPDTLEALTADTTVVARITMLNAR